MDLPDLAFDVPKSLKDIPGWFSPAGTTAIVLDTESYGAVRYAASGTRSPIQTVFHPLKSIRTDNVERKDLLVCASITLVLGEGGVSVTRPAGGWTIPEVAKLHVGPTFVMVLSREEDLLRLVRWLEAADTIFGMNLPFDVTYLRAFSPSCRNALEYGKKELIDLSVLNYLENEARPEKSLKNLGPVLGTHSYDMRKTAKGCHRFKNPYDPELHDYCAQDTHNTLVDCIELSRRICTTHPKSSKLDRSCLEFFSKTLWSVIRMTEAGIAMDRPGLLALAKRCELDCEEATKACFPLLLLEGEGSGKSKSAFMRASLDFVKANGGLGPGGEIVFTPKTGEISWSEENRLLLMRRMGEIMGSKDALLDPRIRALAMANKHAKAQKLLSTYLFPLLYHKRNDPEDKTSLLVPEAYKTSKSFIGNWHISDKAFPTWFTTPSNMKDGSGAMGGTIQARITCKQPAAQTWPPEIKELECSRFSDFYGKCFSLDLRQAELRVAAVLSGDVYLTKAFVEGRDLHSERIQDVIERANIPPGTVESKDWKKVWRQIGKMLNFADLFGASAETMAAQIWAQIGIRIPLDVLRKVVASRPTVRPELFAWQQKMLVEASAKGVLYLPWTGHSRYFPPGSEGADSSEILNFPIQTTSANVLLAIQHELDVRLDKLALRYDNGTSFRPCVITHQVYDALYFDCHEDVYDLVRNGVIPDAVKAVSEGFWRIIGGASVPLEYELS